MIISRTPYRLSFVGGGTDLRSFYAEQYGQVISTTIDKYLFVVVKRQIGIVEYKYRINWSKVEFRNDIDEIEHPIVREALRKMNIDFPIEITTFADIPANTGLGSSSAFAVGLLHALYALKGEMVTKYQLASEAAQIEVDILKRTIGKQDHFAASYGNINVFTFNSDETVIVEPAFYRNETRYQLQKNLILFYTKLKRDASEILESQNKVSVNKKDILVKMRDMVYPMREVLSRGTNLNEFGEILHEGWKLKKSLTADISSTEIENYYSAARNAGAIGGKLLGAGGGGFLLFYVEPEKREAVIKALPGLYHFQPKFDTAGTRITYYDQTTL
jgi:D-glycero-alpha-D-manno-heptose-7-phosphate kinase